LPEEKSDKWIPKPSAKWTRSRTTSALNNYCNFGFDGAFNYFLSDLYFPRPSYYNGFEPDFVPLLKIPRELDDRSKIIFHFLLHCGYLTEVKEGKGEYFKIPNTEIYSVLKEQIDEYLGSIPQKDEIVSEMGKAIVTENFESFGKELLKGLFLYTQKFINDKGNSLGTPKDELTIHHLILKVFESINDEGDYIVRHEHSTGGLKETQGDQKKGSARLREGGYSIDFHLEPTNEGKKIHYVIELKTKRNDEEGGLEKDAFDGLNQIFAKNYLRHILPSKDTKSIITIGLATDTSRLRLAVLKVNIANSSIGSVENLELMEFKVKDKNDTSGEVISGESWIEPLLFQDSPLVENATDADIKKAIEEKIQAIREQLMLKKS
jgi:hypothetical protein